MTHPSSDRRTGCPDLDPNWPGITGSPRGPRVCALYPNCRCGKEDAMTNNSKQSEVVSSNQRVEYRNGLALRLQEWSRNCLIDGLKMDKGEPTLQSLLREAVSLLLAVETTVPDTGLSAATVAEMLRVEAAVVKLGTCMPPGRFPEGVSKYNALMWAAELIDQRSAVEPAEEPPPVDNDHVAHGCEKFDV